MKNFYDQSFYKDISITKNEGASDLICYNCEHEINPGETYIWITKEEYDDPNDLKGTKIAVALHLKCIDFYISPDVLKEILDEE